MAGYLEKTLICSRKSHKVINSVFPTYRLNNTNSVQKPQRSMHSSKISFNGYIEDIPLDKLAHEDIETFAQPLKQNTFFFRLGLSESLDEIMNNFSIGNPRKEYKGDPKKFFVYGCSDGHEPYSIIMYLLQKFGSFEEAKKRVELHSIDIPSPGLKMAQSGKLKIDGDNLLKDYLDLSLISDDYIPSKNQTEIAINKKVQKYANFQEGRIMEDFKPAGKFKENEPVAVFFRSSLPYIKPEIAEQFIYNLYSKLPHKSYFCIGAYDFNIKGTHQLIKLNLTFGNPKKLKYLYKKPPLVPETMGRKFLSKASELLREIKLI